MRTDLPPSNVPTKVLQKMQIRIYFWKKMYFCIKKVHFLKIALPFLPLIPCLIPPTDDRETTERTPHQLPAYKKCFLLRFPEKVTQLSEKLTLPLRVWSEMKHTVYMRFIFTNLS